MNRISEEQVSRLLRRVAERIELLQDEASLVERALEGAVDSFFRVGSPIGPVYIAVGSNGIRHLASAGSPEKFVRSCRERFGRLVSPASEDLITALAGRVEAALAGERVKMPLDLSGTTPFQRRVLEAVKDIPRGKFARTSGSPARPGHRALPEPLATRWRTTLYRSSCRATALSATTAVRGATLSARARR